MKLVICFILIFGTVLAEESKPNSTGVPKIIPPQKTPEVAPPQNEPEIAKAHTSEPSHEITKAAEKITPPTPPPSTVTTTLAPVNPPSNEKGRWNVTDHKNHTCILITGFISLHNITINTPLHKTGFNVSVPPYAPTVGNCANGEIKFFLDHFNSTLQFGFKLNETHEPKEYFLDRVDGLLRIPNKGNSTVGFNGRKLHEFKTNVGQSFQCNTFLKFNFTDVKNKDENVTVVVELKDFQLQAYKNSTKNNEFGEAIDGCPADHVTPDIVPIIVGCALAILVVAVLVAYLISRQRSQARGYLSM